MSSDDPTIPKQVIPIDPKQYSLDPEASEFFKIVTRIQDDDKLREHILDVQAKAYAVAAYPCIRSFVFTRLNISRSPSYQQFLKLGREREGAILLDIGCCFGNDSRKAALDGWPSKQILATDVKRALWDFGYMLFCDTPESFPATFIAGDALSLDFLSPFKSGENPSVVNLADVRTLKDVQGKISAIWAASFFHLFPEQGQRQVAHALGALLSPEPGSMIFGYHISLPGTGCHDGGISQSHTNMFCHNPESWEELWTGSSTTPSTGVGPLLDGPVFPRGSVKLETTLVPVETQPAQGLWRLIWSITRV
ncbi:hypothetical protein JVU11DRAFT_3317 [Chiua virens]|nr:hypothetical protein JVU11DRAFT_3317 [Chiua virens]